MISVISFSFRKGVPVGASLVLDCRGLRNPHLNPRLRHMTGKDLAVQEYVMQDGNAPLMLKDALERVQDGMTIAFGCYGGRHRSVAMAERLAKELGRVGCEVEVIHRELES